MPTDHLWNHTMENTLMEDIEFFDNVYTTKENDDADEFKVNI
jgi:hypothetical protein